MKPLRMPGNCFLLAVVLLCLYLTVGAAMADPVDDLFEGARKKYYTTLALPQEQQAAGFKQGIHDFQEVIKKDSSRKYLDKCLYLIAQIYHRLYDAMPNKTYLHEAQSYYRRLVSDLPGSPLADDSQYLLGIIYLEEDPAQAYLELVKVGLYFPNGDMRPRAEEKATQLKAQLAAPQPKKTDEKPAAAPSFAFASGSSATPSLPSNTPAAPAAADNKNQPQLPQLKGIQHWAGEGYTRVALYVSEPVKFERHDLPAEPGIRDTDRIYIDLKNCMVEPKMEGGSIIQDPFLHRLRVAQYDPTQVRVALDVKDMKSYQIFSLADPYRVIIDVRGKKAEPGAAEKPQTVTVPKGSQTSTLARQLGLRVGVIVLDPGHGGKDTGAISANGVYEKDIVLQIAKKLKKRLEATTGCRVVLTRSTDRFLSLEERTAIANANKADLFVSLHTNAHDDQNLYGTETYFLNLSKDKESARVAAMENATSTRKISDLEHILKDIMLNTKINESAQLAKSVQQKMITDLSRKYDGIKDLGVKQAPFYVLLGAEMPSVLIETAFLSNRKDEQRLRDGNFQETLAAGISQGVESYIQQMKKFAEVGGAR